MKQFKIKSVKRIKQEISFPDIDSDFDGSKRDDIINYLIKKYGRDYVALVGNRLEYSPKSVIRDLGQVYDIPASEVFACTKEYNDNISVHANMRINERVAKFFKKYKDIIDKVDQIVGTVSALGVHAGGVIISDRQYPLNRVCALQRPNESGRVATLFTKDELQPIGLIKYDILGLTTAGQCHLIKKTIGVDPYSHFDEDLNVYRDIVLFKKHKNVFQFESQLGLRAFDDLKPMNFMQLANASSIIRIVGSNDGREIYNKYKEFVAQDQMGNHGYWKEIMRQEIVEDKNYKACEKVLKETFGVLIYQEQLSNLVVELSGGMKAFVDGNQARKLMENHNKKYGSLDSLQGKKDALKQWHKAFIEVIDKYFPYLGKDGRDSDDQDLKDFFNFKLTEEGILPTPKYGIVNWLITATAYLFSKLHAVAYTMNTYDMMYLKYYYPLEFWVGSLIHEQNDLDKVKEYLTAIKLESKIKVLPPNINKSFVKFSIEDKSIRYGLGGILNVGEAAKIIIRERKNGEFKSIEDFCKRVPKKYVNKRVMEGLLYTNAFSDFGSMTKVHKQLIDFGINIGELIDEKIALSKLEAKYLGVAIVNRHPLEDVAAAYLPVTMLEDGDKSDIACFILEIKNKITKTNKPYTQLKCQCLNSRTVFLVFDWNNNEMGLKKGDFQILHLKKYNGFIQLFMRKGYTRQQTGREKFYTNLMR